MTIALLPHRLQIFGRRTRAHSIVQETVAHLPLRTPEAQPTVNTGRWATLPGEYAGAWACPLDERLPAITAPGITAPVACGKNAPVILHLAGRWSGQVAFEGSADGVIWRRVALACLNDDVVTDETDRPGLWRTLPDQQMAHIRLHVAQLSHGAILASVAAASPVGQPIPHSLEPAA